MKNPRKCTEFTTIEREFKGLNIRMQWYDTDFHFVIKGKCLPMVQIGMISAYCDGGDLMLEDFENVTGSDIYVPLTDGRLCESEGDRYPTYMDVFEVGVDTGMYDLGDSQYTMLFYDKNEIIEVLYTMSRECKDKFVEYMNRYEKEVSDDKEIKCCGTCLEMHIEKSDGYMHCMNFGVPVGLFDRACQRYCCGSSRDNSSKVIEDILNVEDFTL